jgi:uncharacterized membrane protein (UPF0127 family)
VAASHFLSSALKGSDASVALGIEGQNGPLATAVELAVDSASRKRGLLGRTSLAPGHALVIAPCGGVHTFAMRFAIDVIFVAKEGRVLKIVPAVKPSRIALCLSAFATIEMAAGEAERAGLQVGQRLTVSTG